MQVIHGGGMFRIDLGITKKFFVAAVISLVLGGAMASESGHSSSTRIFLAGEAAYRDFSKSVERQADRSSGLSVFLANVGNYEITLREETDSYVVTFTPKRYMGQTLRGGSAQYKIDKKDFRVIDVVRYK
jgi:hypothetical protein